MIKFEYQYQFSHLFLIFKILNFISSLQTLYNCNQNSDKTVQCSEGFLEGAHVNVDFKNYNDTAAQWHLVINTSKDVSDEIQAYTAGYAEGYYTADLIEMYTYNMKQDNKENCDSNGTCTWNEWYDQYFTNQEQYIQDYIKQNDGDKWWHGVDLVYNQWLEGMTAGIQVALQEGKISTNISKLDIIQINSVGEKDDLDYFANPAARQWRINAGQTHRCTGTLRNIDLEDIYFSQDTWSSFYSDFIKIAKTYMFNWNLEYTSHQIVSFSSYPGTFFSVDDFYIIHNQDKNGKLGIYGTIETTMHTFNTTLYDLYVNPDGNSTPTWLRAQLSNLYSVTSEQWNVSFNDPTHYPSWTYNNEYVILNYSLLQTLKNQQFTDYIDKYNFIMNYEYPLITSIQVAPNWVVCEDYTKRFLDDGFYMSLNAYSDPALYNYSGYYTENEADGENYWSYEDSGRMCETRKLLPQVYTYEQFQDFVQYNDWKHDDCAQYDSGARNIASRYDLRDISIQDKHEATLFGCTDSKTTNLELASKLQWDYRVGAISGGNSDIPKFNYSEHLDAAPIPKGYWEIFPSVYFRVDGCGEMGCALYDDNQSSDNATVIICAVVIPCVIIAIGLAIWAIIFYRKTRNLMKQPSDQNQSIEEQQEQQKLIDQ